MKIDITKINELCLPLGKRPKKIIGAKVVFLCDMKNNNGDQFYKGEIAEVYQSFRGYGLKVVEDSRVKRISRVYRQEVRFLKENEL